MIIQAEFPIRGNGILLDHGYPLSGAIKKCVPDITTILQENTTRISPILGKKTINPKYIQLNNSLLRIRTEEKNIKILLNLIGKTISIANANVTIKAPQFFSLEECDGVFSKFVAIDSRDKIIKRLKEYVDVSNVEILERKSIQVKGVNVVGYGVLVLSKNGTRELMSYGIGGRGSFGAGWFDPL